MLFLCSIEEVKKTRQLKFDTTELKLLILIYDDTDMVWNTLDLSISIILYVSKINQPAFINGRDERSSPGKCNCVCLFYCIIQVFKKNYLDWTVQKKIPTYKNRCTDITRYIDHNIAELPPKPSNPFLSPQQAPTTYWKKSNNKSY